MKINFKKVLRFLICGSALLFASCSSAPKRAMLVTETSDAAAAFYETANTELVSGKLAAAGGHLQQAYNMALSVDDADLMCRISLSAIIYKMTYKGDSGLDPATQLPKKSYDAAADTPFYGLTSRDLLSMAKSYASRSNDKELLTAVCSIYEVRIKIAENEKFNTDAQVAQLNACRKAVGKDVYYLAFLCRTTGDVNAYGKNYAEARKAYLEAADLHIKNRYLSEIGLDYYSAARMSSQEKNKNRALEEIDTALKYDKDAENTVAIAADYNAYGLILLKDGCTEEEKVRAKNSILWAAKIYQSGGFIEEAAECVERASAL